MHNNSPEAMPVTAGPSVDVRGREKLEGGKQFILHSEFEPAGDQPTAIVELSEGIRNGDRDQVLLGATGTGKTFTMAKLIQETQRPAIILAPNKTLAGGGWHSGNWHRCGLVQKYRSFPLSAGRIR